jgi:hypothetical protein
LDELGPVEMPANTVSVAVDPAGPASERWTPQEAETLVREDLHDQNADLAPDVPLPLEELPVPEVWEQLDVQIFRVTSGPFARETFLIDDETVLGLGTAFGGKGVTSIRVADLDQDGSAELLFTYSFGSGIHQSRIGMVAPAYAKDRIYEAEIAYLGDVGLVQEDTSRVVVRVVESDDEDLILRYTDTLGHLTIQKRGDEVDLVLRLAEDIPDDVRKNLLQATGES